MAPTVRRTLSDRCAVAVTRNHDLDACGKPAVAACWHDDDGWPCPPEQAWGVTELCKYHTMRTTRTALLTLAEVAS